jgi:hypothetical protein
MKIEILVKTVYGNGLYYPQCENAKTFAKLSKTQTLSFAQLKMIIDLGFSVEYYTEINGQILKLGA